MATTKVIGSVLYTGQGMCNAVQVYDGAVLTHLMLIDFGAEKDTATAREYTLETLVKIVNDHGCIDVMVISHSDKDHWKLMSELLLNVKASVKITNAYFGIGDWVNSALEFKNLVASRLATPSITYFPAAYSDIVNTGGAAAVKPLFSLGDVAVSALAASVTEKDVNPYASSWIEANTASIVVFCSFGGNSQIYPGDATRDTLRYMNNLLAGNPLPNKCIMMAAPHHGALATLGGTLADLVTFTAAAKPICAVASAQLRGNFNHPNVGVMSTMAQFAGQSIYPGAGGKHTCVLNFKDVSQCQTNSIYQKLLTEITPAHCEEWYVVNTELNIFTTLQDLTTGVHWFFTMEANGSYSVSQGSVTFGVGDLLEQRSVWVVPDEEEFFVGRPPPGMRVESAVLCAMPVLPRSIDTPTPTCSLMDTKHHVA